MTTTGRDGAMALEVVDLTVTYGSARGITDINLNVPAAGVTGLLGPNGAGKTTLLRTALDLVHPTSGSIRLWGVDSRQPAARRDVTYLPGDLVIPGRLSGWAVLRRYTAGRPALDRTRVESLAARLDLDLDRPVGQLSKGNRQKVGLMLAFAPQGRLLLLDEPTSGLDPLLQREFGALVREATDEGVAVVLSSHVLSELEDLAQRVAVLREGQVVAYESIDDLRRRAEQRVSIRFSSEEDAARFAAHVPTEGIRVLEIAGDWVKVAYAGDADPVIKAAAAFPVRALESVGGELDAVLMSFYGEADAS